MLHTYYIDIAGTCNLRCPSCATGNMSGSNDASPVGFMPLDRYSAILEKIVVERGKNLTRIELYNWGEPLLHPDAAQFIKITKQQPNFRCGTSSNLSLHRLDLAPIVEAQPDWFRVSLSGFFQDAYGQTHKRGEVNLVKSNMLRLRYEMDRRRATFPVEVAFHLYTHNCGRDLPRMKEFCEDLDFNFRPVWASLYPVEKVMDYCEGVESPIDRPLIDLLAVKPEELHAAALAYAAEPCRLQTAQTSINYDGSVQLCCATYERRNVIAANFLDASPEALMKAKGDHPTCDRCIKGAYHAMMMYKGIEATEARANERIQNAGSDFSLQKGVLEARAAKPKRFTFTRSASAGSKTQ